MTDGVGRDDEPSGTGASAPAGEPLPKLSVIVACLNAAVTLGTQLEALARQSSPVPWELLICDNGSTDATVAVALRYRDRLPLRVVDAAATRGAGAARNCGARQARGEWLAFCDADDEVASDWLATMSRALEQHRFVAGRFESQRLNGARVLRSRPLQQQGELQDADFGARLPHAGAGNMGIHRADFLAVDGFDPTMPWLEDTDFSWRVQLGGVPLVFRPEVVVHVRLRQTFRSMFVQGRQYGVAYAVLEQRYGPADPQPAQPAGPPARRRFSAREAVTWFVDHVGAGRMAWRLGWVVGHRSVRGRRLPAPPGGEAGRSRVTLGSP